MLRVVGASDENVFKSSLRVDAKAISDSLDSLMAKCTLGINVGRLENWWQMSFVVALIQSGSISRTGQSTCLAITTAHCHWKLGHYAQSVTNLGLSSPELSKRLGDCHCLDATYTIFVGYKVSW